MLKKLLAIILICALSTQHFYKLVAYFAFKSNQRYISVALCSNRSMPELNCLGACFLDKELKEIEQSQEKTKNLSSQNTKKQDQPASLIEVALVGLLEIKSSEIYIQYTNHYGLNLIADLLRPPQLFSLS